MLDFSLHHMRVQSEGSHLWARKRALMRNQIDQHLEFQPPEMWERSFCYYLSHLVCSILSWQPKQTNRRERSERLRSCFKGTHWPNLGQSELQNEWTDSHFSCSVMSDSLQPHGLQQVRPPCPSPTLGVIQAQVDWVSNAMQPSQHLSSPSPLTCNLSQHQGLFKWVSSSHQVDKVLEFQLQHQSFQWIFRTDLLYDELVGSSCSPRDSQESSPTPQFKSINSSVLSFLHSPTLTSLYDHRKNHIIDYTNLCWQSNVSAFQYAI